MPRDNLRTTTSSLHLLPLQVRRHPLDTQATLMAHRITTSLKPELNHLLLAVQEHRRHQHTVAMGLLHRPPTRKLDGKVALPPDRRVEATMATELLQVVAVATVTTATAWEAAHLEEDPLVDLEDLRPEVLEISGTSLTLFPLFGPLTSQSMQTIEHCGEHRKQISAW